MALYHSEEGTIFAEDLCRGDLFFHFGALVRVVDTFYTHSGMLIVVAYSDGQRQELRAGYEALVEVIYAD